MKLRKWLESIFIFNGGFADAKNGSAPKVLKGRRGQVEIEALRDRNS